MMIEVKRAKLKEGGLLDVEYVQTVAVNDEVIKVGEYNLVGSIVAQDSLVDAFKQLTFHFAMLTECVDESKQSRDDFDGIEKLLDTNPILKNIGCNRFKISGSDSDVITLSGYRKTRYGKKVNMNGQLNQYDDPDCVYEFADILRDHIDNLKQEVIRYVLGNGKDVQLSLFSEVEAEAV